MIKKLEIKVITGVASPRFFFFIKNFRELVPPVDWGVSGCVVRAVFPSRARWA